MILLRKGELQLSLLYFISILIPSFPTMTSGKILLASSPNTEASLYREE